MGTTQSEMRLFARASCSGIAGTLTEAALYYLVLWLGGFGAGLYVPASLFGGLGGAVANFLLNRYWAFRSTEKHIAMQAVQYLIASALTYLAMVGALAVLIEVVRVSQGFAYPPAKLFAWLMVSYPVARFIVFRGEPVGRP